MPLPVEIRIYLFRDAVLFKTFTDFRGLQSAKTVNVIRFPETMKGDVKRYIHKYLQKNLKHVCNKMMLDDGAEAISIDSWAGV